MRQVSSDYVYQSASIIYSKHNIHSSPWWLEIWCWENVCLFVHNMQSKILSNRGEKVLNYIMCGRVVSPMNTTKYAYPYQIYGMVAYVLRKTISCGMGEA
jgi:hypothetical protein